MKQWLQRDEHLCPSLYVLAISLRSLVCCLMSLFFSPQPAAPVSKEEVLTQLAQIGAAVASLPVMERACALLDKLPADPEVALAFCDAMEKLSASLHACEFTVHSGVITALARILEGLPASTHVQVSAAVVVGMLAINVDANEAMRSSNIVALLRKCVDRRLCIGDDGCDYASEALATLATVGK